MARVDYRQVKKSEQRELVRDLTAAFVLLEDKKHTEEFLNAFLTPSELVMLGRRWQIALRLLDGQTYLKIREKLGVGFQTIERVDRWLYTSLKNYDRITNRQRKRLRNKSASSDDLQLQYGSTTGSFEELRRRYSLPFLLVNLLIGTVEPVRSAVKKKSSSSK